MLKRVANEKLIIFACRLPTVEFITDKLIGRGYSVQTYHGSLGKNERKKALADFKASSQMLVGTDAMAEGLNLQFAGLMVNWDLPWNPMTVEQRIGRIDRLTQKREKVGVNNIYVKNTIEERIIRRLYEKLDLFKVAVGEMDMVLGELQQENAFEISLFKQIVDAGRRKGVDIEKSAITESLRKAKKHAKESNVFSNKVLGQINPGVEVQQS